MCPLHDVHPHDDRFPPDEFSLEERTLLLRLAHEAIAAGLDQREISPDPPSAHLAELRGVFTTLYLGGALRGCVGYVLPVSPLYRTVVESARGAAFDDSRFPPVTHVEAGELEVSLSVLSPPRPIRGLLLPQVPVEHGWDRIAFLEQTCRKAGLPPNAWQTGARLEAFTAEVFGDSK
jgi:uncharacterized protein